MKARMTLERLREFTPRQDPALLPVKPLTPDNFAASGRKLSFYLTWSEVDSADGYQVAVMTGNDLANPELLIDVPGKSTMQWSYSVGDTALARTFSIHSYKDSITGERLYSEFFYPLRTATSTVDGGAADAAPSSPPAPSPSPDTGEGSGSPGGVEPVIV